MARVFLMLHTCTGNGPIEIKESDEIVGQSKGHDPYGLPIDATLAVELIRELWKRVHAERVPHIETDIAALVAELTIQDEKTIADRIAAIRQLAVKAQTWLDNLAIALCSDS
jgi:hypothetical protein